MNLCWKQLSRLAIPALLVLPVVAEARLAELLSDQIAAEVQDLVMNDLVGLNHQQMQDGESAPDNDGPILGMPTLDRMLTERLANVWMNPTYWETYVREAVLNANLQLPAPTDVVRPEIWTANVLVPNGEYISSLPKALQDISQLTYEWQGARKTVEDYVITTETDALVFLVNGALVDEIYNNGYNAETRHQPWSVTKTFIAATVGVAYEEGYIDSLQDPIEQYIPELQGTAWEGVTVENLLQMESGVHWDEGTPVLVQNTQVEQWIQVALDHYSQGQLGMTRNEFLKSLPKVFEQGTQFAYNSGNPQVLAWMLELIYEKPFNEIISEKLWQPMGAQGDAKMIADREGGVIASQGLYARAQDFARFGELMRNNGVTSDGRRVLSAEWVKAMTRMTDVSNGAYGYQTWSSNAGEGAFSGVGFEGNFMTVVPHKCFTAVRLSHGLGARYRNGDAQDPNAYGFFFEDGSGEGQAMVKQLSEQIGGCADSVPAGGGHDGKLAGGGGASSGALLIVMLGLLARRFSRRR